MYFGDLKGGGAESRARIELLQNYGDTRSRCVCTIFFDSLLVFALLMVKVETHRKKVELTGL